MKRYLVEPHRSTMGAGGPEAGAALARAAADEVSRERVRVRFLRWIFIPEEETWFLLYEGLSRPAVKDAVARAGLACARVLEAGTQSNSWRNSTMRPRAPRPSVELTDEREAQAAREAAKHTDPKVADVAETVGIQEEKS